MSNPVGAIIVSNPFNEPGVFEEVDLSDPLPAEEAAKVVSKRTVIWNKLKGKFATDEASTTVRKRDFFTLKHGIQAHPTDRPDT